MLIYYNKMKENPNLIIETLQSETEQSNIYLIKRMILIMYKLFY